MLSCIESVRGSNHQVNHSMEQNYTERRLFIKDKRCNLKYLIDSGSAVSIIPSWKQKAQEKSSSILYAANSTPINTFGTTLLT